MDWKKSKSVVDKLAPVLLNQRSSIHLSFDANDERGGGLVTDARYLAFDRGRLRARVRASWFVAPSPCPACWVKELMTRNAEDSFILLDALEQDALELRALKPSLCVEIGYALLDSSTLPG